MGLWTGFVDLIYATLVTLSTMFGGNMALAIGVLSLSVRLAFLPLTLRMARHSLAVQAALKKLEPQIAKIRDKHRNDPSQMWQKTAELHRKHGIRLGDARGLMGMLIQAPLVIGLIAAFRRGVSGSKGFLWIKDLMQSDPVLACLCSLLAAVSAALAANVSGSQRTAMIVLPAVLTLLFMWRVSAGLAIYSLSYNIVGVAQSLLLRRTSRR